MDKTEVERTDRYLYGELVTMDRGGLQKTTFMLEQAATGYVLLEGLPNQNVLGKNVGVRIVALPTVENVRRPS